MEKFKEIMLIIGQLLLKGLKAFWAFMVKPNKKSKVSKWNVSQTPTLINLNQVDTENK